VTLIDENVENIDFERVVRADLVCLTGMNIQGNRLIEILQKVKSHGVMTVVGGPMATVEPESLDGLADVIFVGEADETWPQFLDDWERGCHKSRYEQQEKTDLTKLPLPRIDLLKVDSTCLAACRFRAAVLSPASSVTSSLPSEDALASRQVTRFWLSLRRSSAPDSGFYLSSTTILSATKKPLNQYCATSFAGNKSEPIR